MCVIVLILLVEMAASAYAPIAKSDLTSSVVTAGFSISLSDFHNSYQSSYLGENSYWIWTNEGRQSPPNREVTFEKLFYSACSGPMILNITADDSFAAYFDGELIGEGNNYVRVYSIPLSPGCGAHNLTVTVRRGSSLLGPGLIWVIFQEQSSCFTCNLNAEWNDHTCSCHCLAKCGCGPDKVWVQYPTCSCLCR